MPQKLIDFLSSVGIMVFGVGLVFFSSVTLTSNPVQNFVSNLPKVVPFVPIGGDIQLQVLPVSKPAIPVVKEEAELTATLTAKVIMVVDDQSNTILYKRNADEIRSLASITKLMSALVLSDLGLDWATSTIITDEDFDNFSHHLAVGERYTLEDLWDVSLVGSSNSAINALVRSAGFTQEDFVKKMNDKAQALGLNSLRFVEPTGLDSRNMGAAVDVLRLLKAALKVEKISKSLQNQEIFISPLDKKQKKRVWNTNWLLTNWIPNKFDKDVLVGKTGFIEQSGYNLVVRLPGPKSHVIRVVILGAETNEARFSEARDIGEWIFQNYLWPDDEEYKGLVQ